MSTASPSSSSQRVPAWKRMGLQLKPAAATLSPPSAAVGNSSSSANSVRGSGGGSSFSSSTSRGGAGANPRASTNATALGKRKYPDTPASASSAKFRRGEGHTPDDFRPAKKGRVAFANDPAAANKAWPGRADSGKGRRNLTQNFKEQSQQKAPKKVKASKGPSAKRQQEPDFGPPVEYLRQWKLSRDTWKFNKNYQTRLIKNIFKPKAIPATDIDTFYEYIRDIKGYIRSQLRDAANEIRQADIEAGPKGFAEGTMSVEDKQMEYETTISSFQKLGPQGTKRKSFLESDFMQNHGSNSVSERVVKRMRAEMILDALSDSDGNTEETTTNGGAPTNDNASMVTDEADAKRAKLNDGRKVPRKRKARVSNLEESSSESSSDDIGSDEDDDSEEEASGSSSESEDSDDEDGGAQLPAVPAEETSSSSPSSSDFESEESDDDEA